MHRSLLIHTLQIWHVKKWGCGCGGFRLQDGVYVCEKFPEAVIYTIFPRLSAHIQLKFFDLCKGAHSKSWDVALTPLARFTGWILVRRGILLMLTLCPLIMCCKTSFCLAKCALKRQRSCPPKNRQGFFEAMPISLLAVKADALISQVCLKVSLGRKICKLQVVDLFSSNNPKKVNNILDSLVFFYW